MKHKLSSLVLTFTLSSFLLLSVSSCKKDKGDASNGVGTITCTIDGVSTTFKTNVRAIRTDIGGEYSIQVIGFQGEGSSNQIALDIVSSSVIAAGTYSEDGSTGDNVASVNFIQSASSFPYISNNSTSNPSAVTVTSVSESFIAGTFKGDVYLINGSGVTDTKKVITTGRFNAAF